MTQFDPRLMLFPDDLLLTVKLPTGCKGLPVFDEKGKEIGFVVDAKAEPGGGYTSCLIKITEDIEAIRKKMESPRFNSIGVTLKDNL